MRLLRFDDLSAFRARAIPHLARREGLNNLSLGLLGEMSAPPPGQLLVLVENDHAEIAAVGLHTPPFKLVLDDAEPAACALLAEALTAEEAARLAGVVGPTAVASVFAERHAARWAKPSTGGVPMLAYQLERVTPPAALPPGAMRLAGTADRALCATWLEAFSVEAGTQERADGGALADALIALQRLFLWDDGGPAALAAWKGPTPRGARIAPVYTPPDRRGRGYGSAISAALAQRILDGGRERVFLFADLGNSTANHIYRAIGFRPVGEIAELRFR